MRKKSWIVQTLILSVLLNGLLFGIFCYFLVRETPLFFAFRPASPKPSSSMTLSPAFLESLRRATPDALIASLEDRRLVEQEYAVRDFALAALIAYHDYDLPRALGKLPYQPCICGTEKLTLYSPLTEQEYAKVSTFLRVERFPYTTKGMFARISAGMRDPEALSYFCHTPEFLLLETLFARTGLPLSKGVLLRLAQEGGWERLSAFYTTSQEKSDFSDSRRQKLLLSYLEGGSQTAAYLLVVTDLPFVLHWVAEAELSQMLSLMKTKTREAVAFSRQLLASPRSAEIHQLAAQRLADYGETEAIAGHFLTRPAEGSLRPLFRSAPPAAPSPRQHIVQPGESLWLIAARYHVSLETLMEANQLRASTIRPGQTLSIPD